MKAILKTILLEIFHKILSKRESGGGGREREGHAIRLTRAIPSLTVRIILNIITTIARFVIFSYCDDYDHSLLETTKTHWIL